MKHTQLLINVGLLGTAVISNWVCFISIR